MKFILSISFLFVLTSFCASAEFKGDAIKVSDAKIDIDLYNLQPVLLTRTFPNVISSPSGGGIPALALTYNGQALTYNADYLTYGA